MANEEAIESTAVVAPVEAANVVKGMVLYADAGCRPNPGPGGLGIHGYIYNATNPTKGIGRTFEVTSRGYAEKSKVIRMASKGLDPVPYLNKWEHLAITPIEYVDYYGTVASASNNACEISAVTKALQLAKEHDISYLQILTDSEYTKNGANGWIDNWAANRWCKSDGTEVINAGLWQLLKTERDEMSGKGVKMRFDWVRSHNGEPGNEKADFLATIGVFQSKEGLVDERKIVTPADSYWKNMVNKHPFLSQRRCYFNTLAGASTPGTYYLGDHGKDDDLIGKRIADTSYAVVQLGEPDKALEAVRTIQSHFSNGADSLYEMFLDQVYSVDTWSTLDQYGKLCIEPPTGYRMDLRHHDGSPITREFKPARMVMSTVDVLVELAGLLEKVKNNDPSIVKTDITPSLYEISYKVIKAKKSEPEKTETVFKLRPELVVGLASITVPIQHPYSVGEELTELKLSMGIDILDRNALKRLEDKNPSVYVVTWSVSEKAFRYATIVEAGDSKGIWSGAYSNIRLVV